MLKGIDVDSGADDQRHAAASESRLARRLEDADGGLPGIILGSRLAQDIGMLLNSVVTVISPQGELTPFGPRPSIRNASAWSGFSNPASYEIDDNWAYTSLPAAQKAAFARRCGELDRSEAGRSESRSAGGEGSREDRRPEVRRDHLDGAEPAALSALQDGEVGDVVTIGLIELVAALNILITLVMMVMEKYRDIAVLMSMGARREQIRRSSCCREC